MYPRKYSYACYSTRSTWLSCTPCAPRCDLLQTRDSCELPVPNKLCEWEEGANKPGLCITKPNSVQSIKLKKPLTMDEYNAQALLRVQDPANYTKVTNASDNCCNGLAPMNDSQSKSAMTQCGKSNDFMGCIIKNNIWTGKDTCKP